MTVLTIDLGTSATKAALWSDDGVVGLARAPVPTDHPSPERAEQDARDWWASVIAACQELRQMSPGRFGAVEAIGFAAARETFVLVDEHLDPLGPGILWSDHRAEAWADVLEDPIGFRATTGVVAGPGAHAAKLAWVAQLEPDAMAGARWVLAPRDLVVATITGCVATDPTLASRTGLSSLDGQWLPDAVTTYERRLPEIRPSADVVGTVTPDAAAALGVPRTTQVVIGAGDRSCEVLGVGATSSTPMVSWGTTANVSIPHAGPVDALPAVAQVSIGALGGWVVEAGLSAAGAAIAWLARLTGSTPDDLLDAAEDVPPGARGVLALPWLAGARAPWWKPDAHGAFVGLTEAHGPPELARAVVEGVAFDVARCRDLIAPEAQELSLAGAGAARDLWRSALAAAAGRPVVRRTVDDAASVGARLLVASALGESVALDDINPVSGREEPDVELVRAYAPVRDAADAAASAMLEL